MATHIRSYGQAVVRVLAAHTVEPPEKRGAHAFALLLVVAIAIVKHVSGMTVHDTRFTLYALAIVVADRLAAVVMQDRGLRATAS